MDFAYLHGLAEAEVVDVEHKALGDCGVEGFHAEFFHHERELTTGFHTFCVAFELNGHFHDDGLVFVHFEQVDVQDGVLHGVELYVFEHGHALVAVDVEFDGENFGSVDEFAHCLEANHEVGGDKSFAVADFDEFFAGFEGFSVGEFYDFAAIENCGDFVFGAESLGGFFAKVGARLCSQLKFLHFCLV